FYAKMNPDVVAVLGNDANALFNHFLQFGINEGRRINPYFDVNAYKKAYPDLVAAFGDDIAAYYNHFANHGISEHRTLGGFPAEKIVPGAAVAYSGSSSSSSSGGGGSSSSKPATKPADEQVTPTPVTPEKEPEKEPEKDPEPTPVPEKTAEEKAKDALDNAVKAAEDADKALKEANKAYSDAAAEVGKQDVDGKNTTTDGLLAAVVSTDGTASIVAGENKLTSRAIASANSAIAKAQNNPTASNKQDAINAATAAVLQATDELQAANSNVAAADKALKAADNAVKAAQAATVAADEALAQAKSAKVAADDKVAAVKEQINANRTRLALAQQAETIANQNFTKVNAEQQEAVKEAYDALVVAAKAFGDDNKVDNNDLAVADKINNVVSNSTKDKLDIASANLVGEIETALTLGQGNGTINDLDRAKSAYTNAASTAETSLVNAKKALLELVPGAEFNADGTVTAESVNRAMSAGENKLNSDIKAQFKALKDAIDAKNSTTQGTPYYDYVTELIDDALQALVDLGCYKAGQNTTAYQEAEADLINNGAYIGDSTKQTAAFNTAKVDFDKKYNDNQTGIKAVYDNAVSAKQGADTNVENLSKLVGAYEKADLANKDAEKEYKDAQTTYKNVKASSAKAIEDAQEAVDAAHTEVIVIQQAVTSLETTDTYDHDNDPLTPAVTKLGAAQDEAAKADAQLGTAERLVKDTADEAEKAAENKEAADEAKAAADEAKATAEQNLETANGQQTTANGIVVTN
ncbi:hypothetical protein SAMN02910384_02802, partial [Pseudobutyrivibrio sp. ACV-2]